MNKKGALEWEKIIAYLILALVLIALIVLFVIWRGIGFELISNFFK